MPFDINSPFEEDDTLPQFDPNSQFIEEPDEEVGTLQGIANSAQNAFDSSKQALLAVGGVDQDQAEQISKLEYAKQARKVAPGYAEYQKAEGMDAVGAFLRNPVEVTTNIIGEGLAGSLPALGAGVATGAAGAAVGSVVPGIGTGIGYTAGQVAGTFGGSLSTEYGSKILEELQNSGMDITDPNSIQSYFSDEEKLAPIRDKALARGVPIAAFDAVSAGIGGKLGRVFGSEIIKEGEKVLGKKFATKTGEALTELGAQAVLGGGGSVAGSVAAGEEVDLKDVFAEVIGEVGTGSIEVLQGKIADRANQRKLIEAKANQDILNLSETLEQNNAPQTARATTQELAKQLSDDLNVDREEEAVELADLGGQTLKKINEVKAETQTATTKEEVAANLSEEDLNTREQDAEKLAQQYKDAYFESQDPNDRAKAVEFQGVLDAIQAEKRKRSYEKGRSAPTQQQDVTTPTVEEVVTPTTGTEVIPLRDAIIQSGIPEEAADIYIDNLKSEGINEDQIREIADNNKSLREEAARKNEEESIAKRDLAQRARMGDKEARAQLEGERGILATPTTEDITAVPPVAEAATLPVEQAPLTQQAVAQQVETQPYATQEIIQPESVRQEPQDGTQVRPTAETIVSDSILGTERSQEEGQVTPVVSDLQSVASNTATPEQLTKLSQSGLVDIVKGQPVINEDGQAALTQAQAPLPKLTPTERRAEIEAAPVSETPAVTEAPAAEVVPTRNWESYSEELRGDLESFSAARGTGRIDYDMMDVADRFVDFAKNDTSGKPLSKLVTDFGKTDFDSTTSQIKKLRTSVKSVEQLEQTAITSTPTVTEAPAAEVAPTTTTRPAQEDVKASRYRKFLGESAPQAISEAKNALASFNRSNYGKLGDNPFQAEPRLRELKNVISSFVGNRLSVTNQKADEIAEQIILGKPNIVDKVTELKPIKAKELDDIGAIRSSITRFGYEQDDKKTYRHPRESEGISTAPAISETITPVSPTGPQVGQRVRSGSTPQPFVITEVTPQTARDVELGEQYYKIKNERTGEVSTVESVDITPIKTTRSSKKLKAVYPIKGGVEPSVSETITPAIKVKASATPEITARTPSPIENIFDARNGIGQVPDNSRVNYRGFVKYMTPNEFRSLVPFGVSGKETKSFVVNALKEGKKLGQPFISAAWNEAAGVWEIDGHEGRSRTDAIKEVYGNVPIPVHIFPRNGIRGRDITNQMRSAPFISEDDVAKFNRTPESITPISIETSQSVVPSDPAIEASAVVTPKIDTEYLAAVESGDMETAQRMVDEAAKKAGYVLSGFHGSIEKNITQFKNPTWVAKNKILAERYSEDYQGEYPGEVKFIQGKVYPVIVNPGKTLKLWRFKDWVDLVEKLAPNNDVLKSEILKNQTNYAFDYADTMPIFEFNDPNRIEKMSNWAKENRTWDNFKKTTLRNRQEAKRKGEEYFVWNTEGYDLSSTWREDYDPSKANFNSQIKLVNSLFNLGYDTLAQFESGREASTDAGYLIKNPNQIKSADPVTYDDAGNVIPLSQRFNQKTPDIRYARARDKAKYRQEYKSAEVLTKINNYIKNGLVEMKEAGANGDTELIEEISKKIKFASKYNINESELYSEKELEDGVRNFFKGNIPSNVIFTNDIGDDSYASYALETGEIEINRAYFKRNVNIDVIIGHELGHFAFGDPEFQKIFISFWDDLTQEQRDAISEYVEENYSSFSPDIRNEEKVIRAWQALLEQNPEIRSKWQKFVEAVKRFLNKYFSTEYEVNDSDKFVLNILNAIRQDFISGKKMLREDGGDFKLQAKAQVHGQKEAGRELESFIGGEKIVQDIVRQNYFDSTQFNDENTQKAYDLLQSLTDFTDGNNNEFAIKLNEDIQSKLKDQDVHPDIKQVIGVQILRNELQRYSNKLIVSGDPFFEKIYKLNANDIPLGIKDVTSSNIARALGAIAKINNPMIGAIQAQGKGEVVQLASTTFGTKEPSTEQIEAIEEALKESGKAETIRNEDVLDSVVSAESKTGVNIRKDIDATIKKSGVKQKTVDDVIGSTETGKTEFAGVDASTAKASIKKQATSPIDAQAERAIEGLAKLQSDVQEWPNKTQNQVRSIVQQDLRQRPDMARKEAWKSLLTSKLMNAGVSESNAMTLSDLIWKQHEINNMNREIKLIESAAENGSLGVIVEMIKNTPLQQQSTPEWRKEVIRQYLMSAGLSEKQAESAARLYDNIIAEKIAEAKQKAFEQSISKTSPWRDHMSRNGQLAKDALKKVLNAVRTSALDPTQNTESIIAKQNGWTGFSEGDFRRIAEIDEILNNKDTDDLKKSEVMKELNEIISKTKLPVTVKQALAAFYTGQALMGIPTVTVNVFSPLGFSLRNLVTDIGRFALTDPTRIPLAFDTFLDSMRSWYNQTKYAFKNEVYPNDVVEYLNGNNVLKELYNKGKKEWKNGEYGSGMRDMLVGMTQITGRVLSALDQGAISALENQAVNRYAMEAMSLSNIPRSKRNAVARQILQAKRNTYASLIAGGMEKERAGVLADMEMKNEIKKQLSSLNIESEKVNDVINSALNDALLSVGRNRTISMDGLTNEQKRLSDDGMISYLPIKFLEQIASSSAQQGPLMQVFSKMLYGFALVPARAFHNAAWYSPYGFLRIFRDKYQKSKGMESSYSLSLGNELQYRQRLTESIAGSLVMLGLGALVKSSTDDEEDDKFKIVVTGNGPDAAADKQYYDSWIKKWKPYSIHIVMGDTVIPINIGRGGEAIFFPILMAGALDDWNIRNQMNKAKKKPADLNQATVMLGSAFLALAQRGPYAAFGKSLFNANRAGQLPEEVAAQAGYFGKTFIPIVGTSLARNISDLINDPIDKSSISGSIYSNIPIVGPMIGTKALNAFGQPIRADDWGDKLFKLGVPMVFSFPKNTPMNELNELVLSKGDGPTIPTRRNAEAKLERPMTNEEFYAYTKTYGDYVSKSMFRSRKSLERMDASRYQSQLEEYAQDASKRAIRSVKRMSIE